MYLISLPFTSIFWLRGSVIPLCYSLTAVITTWPDNKKKQTTIFIFFKLWLACGSFIARCFFQTETRVRCRGKKKAWPNVLFTLRRQSVQPMTNFTRLPYLTISNCRPPGANALAVTWPGRAVHTLNEGVARLITAKTWRRSSSCITSTAVCELLTLAY